MNFENELCRSIMNATDWRQLDGLIEDLSLSELLNSLFPEKPAETTNMFEILSPLDPTSPLDTQMGPFGIQAPVIEDASPGLAYAPSDEISPNSPRIKRQKFENTEEGTGCKHCKCKKTRCLKLYCQCFAAGVYCMDPCSCQGCFNKPIYEDTILATRKAIQSRNPIAFSPRVISTSDALQNARDDSTRTPPSARHKQGCNCKKSNCLKKYCECYQSGVGCSITCRCDDCQNSFGKKDGCFVLEIKDVTRDAQNTKISVIKKDAYPPEIHNIEEQNSEFSVSMAPLMHSRLSDPPLTSFNEEPARSSFIATTSSCSSFGLVQTGRSTVFRWLPSLKKHICGIEKPAVLQSNSPSNGIKILSPSDKRILPPHPH